MGIRLPWNDIHEYLLSLEAATSQKVLFSSALANLDTIVPWDSFVSVMDFSANFLGGLGHRDGDIELYARHYRGLLPIWDSGRIGVPLRRIVAANQVDWEDFGDTEFVNDFARPRGWRRCIGQMSPATGQRLALCAFRDSHSRPFTETEISALRVASQHLNNFASIFGKLAAQPAERLSPALIRDLCPKLSFRESEVARFSYFGLTAREIAAKLFISDRTVEAHLMHIYEKLDIRTKSQLRALIDSASF